MRLGPFCISTAALAYTVSFALHAGVVIALLAWRPTLEPPRMAVAAGRDAAPVTMRFLTPEQLEAMTNPPRESLEITEPIEDRPLPVEPPIDPPNRLPTVQVQAEFDEPIDTAASGPLPAPPITPPAQSNARPQPPTPPAENATESPTPTPTDPQPSPSTPTVADEAGVDREPTPINLPRPHYPTLSRRLGEQGEVILSFTVTADGSVTDIEVEKDPGHPRLIAAAKAALQSARFTPATRNNRPVPYRVAVPFRFQLD